jgi:hypothetical protein
MIGVLHKSRLVSSHNVDELDSLLAFKHVQQLLHRFDSLVAFQHVQEPVGYRAGIMKAKTTLSNPLFSDQMQRDHQGRNAQ